MGRRDRLRRLEQAVARPAELGRAVVLLPFNGRDPSPGRYGAVVIYEVGGPDDPDFDPAALGDGAGPAAARG